MTASGRCAVKPQAFAGCVVSTGVVLKVACIVLVAMGTATALQVDLDLTYTLSSVGDLASAFLGRAVAS